MADELINKARCSRCKITTEFVVKVSGQDIPEDWGKVTANRCIPDGRGHQFKLCGYCFPIIRDKIDLFIDSFSEPATISPKG